MLIEHVRKLQKRPCHADFRDRTVNDLTEVVLLKFIALVTGQQNIVAQILICNNLTDRRIGLFPCCKLNILKGDEDDRVFSLLTAILLAAAPDLFVLEIPGSIRVADLEEGLQHIHCQCFSEASRTGKKRNLGLEIDKLLEHQGLIHIVVPRNQLLEIGHTNR